jgi:hypothetical protein
MRGLSWLAALLFAAALASMAADTRAATAIVVKDRSTLRSGPRDSAQGVGLLWQGEMVEVRGQRMDFVQVYDHQRERGGFVAASELRPLVLTPTAAPELLATLRFLGDTPGAEALGIGYAAAWIAAATPAMVQGETGSEVLTTLGSFADRLATRASSPTSAAKASAEALSAHLEIAGRYGVRFQSFERDGRMQVCYEGDAFRRVLASPASSSMQRATAALGLTRLECVDERAGPLRVHELNVARAGLLERVEARSDATRLAPLPDHIANRVLMRQAAIWASLAYERTRLGEDGGPAARRALAAMESVKKTELGDDDLRAYADAAMRVSASRWAASDAVAMPLHAQLSLTTTAGAEGETCVTLASVRKDAAPLARRCTYGVVWTRSASLNREGTALALAVQQTPAWREMWIFRKGKEGWRVDVLPPAAIAPGIGYVELAGWPPGGNTLLLAREAQGEGKRIRAFEVLRLESLTVAHRANDPALLPVFQRWQDAGWKQATLSLR